MIEADMPHAQIEEFALLRFEQFHPGTALAAHVGCPGLFADLVNAQSCHQEYCLRHRLCKLQWLPQLQRLRQQR